MNVLKRGALTWLAVMSGLLAHVAVAADTRPEHWAATWAQSLQQGVRAQNITIKDQTVRQMLNVSIGGTRLRIHISNEYGANPLNLAAASIAIANEDQVINPDATVKPATVKPGTFVKLTFGGSAEVIVPPGAQIVSDPVDWKFTALQGIAVSLFFRDATSLSTYHLEDRRSYERRGYPRASEESLVGAVVSTEGDFTEAASMPIAPTRIYPPFLSAIDVVAPEKTRVVVCLCATKSEGPDMWPNFLRDRISPPAGGGIAVINEAQSAGTLSLYRPAGTAITRFDRDVLGVAGVTDVLLGPGLASNDVNMPGMNGQRAGDAMTNGAIIFGIRQIIERAHAAGIKVIGTTLLPFEGVLRPGYATPEHMEKRDAINQWIRTSGAFDGLVDFDAVVRDPADPERLLPRYDGGNHFEASEAGMRAMAAAVARYLAKSVSHSNVQ